MSTMIALFLVLSALAGCASETLVNVKNALPETALSCAVEVENRCGVLRDSQGAALADYAYEMPVLRILREDGTVLDAGATEEELEALELAETFNTCFAVWEENALEQLEAAEADQEFRTKTEGPCYTSTLRCTVYRTAGLVSVRGVYESSAGGERVSTVLLSWNFDLETGSFFDPELLDEDGVLRTVVQNELTLQAREAAAEQGEQPEAYFWPDYAAILADWTNYAVSFDGSGMTVGFSPYELAAQGAGPQVFQIPYQTLLPYLNQHSRELLGLDS